jgi:hypothetical protein
MIVPTSCGYCASNIEGVRNFVGAGAPSPGRPTNPTLSLGGQGLNGPWSWCGVTSWTGDRQGGINGHLIGVDSVSLSSRMYVSNVGELRYYSDTGPVDVPSGLVLEPGVPTFVGITVAASTAIAFYKNASRVALGNAVITGRANVFRYLLTGNNDYQYTGALGNTGLWYSTLTQAQMLTLYKVAMGVP